MKKIYTAFFAKITSHDFVYLFSDPPYLYFSLSVFFSQIAFNMLSVVLIFLVFFLTSSNFSVAILLLTILLPQILLSFVGGIVADLSNKRAILFSVNLIRAGALLILFLNSRSLVLVYFVSLLISIVTQFYVPAEAPLIPALVKKSHLISANSIFGIGLFGSILIGYVLAGPVITTLGRSGVFLVLSAGFLIAAIFALLIPKNVDRKKSIPQRIDQYVIKSITAKFKESFSMLKNTSEIGGAFSLLIFSQVIILILSTLVPGYAKNILQVPAEDLSLILFAPAAIGMIVSAVLLSTVFKKIRKGKLMNIGVLISGAVLIMFPLTSRIISKSFVLFLNSILPQILQIDIYHLVLVIAFFAGFANALIFVPSQAMIQEAIPESFRSKIYGLLFALIGVFSLPPIIISGSIADLLGVGAVLVGIGATVVLTGLIRMRPIFKKIK